MAPAAATQAARRWPVGSERCSPPWLSGPPHRADPAPWNAPQVACNYPVYQPKTVLSLSHDQTSSCCRAEPAETSPSSPRSVRRTPPFHRRQGRGFSVAEGYPLIRANPGVAKQVGVWTVGIPRVRQPQGLRLSRPGTVQELHHRLRGQKRSRAPVGEALPVRHEPQEGDANVHGYVSPHLDPGRTCRGRVQVPLRPG